MMTGRRSKTGATLPLTPALSRGRGGRFAVLRESASCPSPEGEGLLIVHHTQIRQYHYRQLLPRCHIVYALPL